MFLCCLSAEIVRSFVKFSSEFRSCFVLQVTGVLQVFSKEITRNGGVGNALEMCGFILFIKKKFFLADA